MRIEPASMEQIRQGSHGRMVLISRDAGGVADDLRRIDQGLKVRFAENGDPPFWAVYHENHEGCPHNGAGGEGSTYLVNTVKAWQNASGTWEGLDQRVVDRIMRIGHSSYDYAREIEKGNVDAERAAEQASSERIQESGEQLAHAIRKDLGATNRAFIP